MTNIIYTIHKSKTERFDVYYSTLLFIYLFKNSTQYKQYKIEDTIKAAEF